MLGNISKDFSVDNTIKTRLHGYMYDFSVDFDSIDVDDILNILKYINIKAWYKIMHRVIK